MICFEYIIFLNFSVSIPTFSKTVYGLTYIFVYLYIIIYNIYKSWPFTNIYCKNLKCHYTILIAAWRTTTLLAVFKYDSPHWKKKLLCATKKNNFLETRNVPYYIHYFTLPNVDRKFSTKRKNLRYKIDLKLTWEIFKALYSNSSNHHK